MGASTPITTFAQTSTTPSTMYGLYQSSSARNRQNHEPQSRQSDASSRLITGLAMSTSSCHDTPDQKSMAKEIPTNTMPVPRSGCFMMSSHGMPTTTAGFHSSTIDFGASRL